MVLPLFKFALQYSLIILCFCASFSSHSAVVDGLFKSSVEVNSQQPSERGDAFNQALVKTLIKLSGHRDLVQQEQIQSQFFPAERFVQSFSYKENPEYHAYLQNLKLETAEANDQKILMQDSINENSLETQNIEHITQPLGEISPDMPDSIPLPFILDVEFADASLESQMKRVNIPIWGKVRPEIMVWALVESDGERKLMGLSEEVLVKGLFEKAANQFALPITFPIADEIDLSVLSLSDLWGLFPDAIDQASQRYAENGNIMIRLHKSIDNIWSSNWQLLVNNSSNTGSFTSDSIEELTSEIINFVSVALSERFSITYSDELDSQTINLEISGINSFKEFIDVQSFLESLAPVKEVNLETFEADMISLSISLNSSYEQFKEYLNLSGKLLFLSTNSYQTLLEPIQTLSNNEPDFDQTKVNQMNVEINTVDQTSQDLNDIQSGSLKEESSDSTFLKSTVQPTPSMLFKNVDKYKWIGQTLGKRE